MRNGFGTASRPSQSVPRCRRRRNQWVGNPDESTREEAVENMAKKETKSVPSTRHAVPAWPAWTACEQANAASLTLRVARVNLLSGTRVFARPENFSFGLLSTPGGCCITTLCQNARQRKEELGKGARQAERAVVCNWMLGWVPEQMQQMMCRALRRPAAVLCTFFYPVAGDPILCISPAASFLKDTVRLQKYAVSV